MTSVVLERSEDAGRPATADPRARAAWLERHATIPDGTCERFDGYGVMGLPFSSGHILALRRFPASSIGPAYSSIWHRLPSGRWTFYTDNEPGRDCTRYFSASVNEAIRTEIAIDWLGSHRLEVRIPATALAWEIEVAETWQTRLINATGALLPPRLWRHRPTLAAMSFIVRQMLGTGPVRLWGRSSNGQHFIANPRHIWLVSRTRATIGDDDLGAPAPAPQPVRLGDFRIPQRGILAFGQSYFAWDGPPGW